MSNPGLNAIYNGGVPMGMIGLGRRRPRRHGRGFMDFLKKANTFVKDNKLISKGLALAESTGLADKLRESTLGNLALQGASMAADHGYGRRRMVDKKW